MEMSLEPKIPVRINEKMYYFNKLEHDEFMKFMKRIEVLGEHEADPQPAPPVLCSYCNPKKKRS